jgi:hypothetical protein
MLTLPCLQVENPIIGARHGADRVGEVEKRRGGEKACLFCHRVALSPCLRFVPLGLQPLITELMSTIAQRLKTS